MKNTIYIIAFLIFGSSASAQVAIGKSSVTNPSVSLEFANEAKGIILPYITDKSALSSAVAGTLIMDADSGVIQYLKDGNSWQDLSFTGKAFIDGTEQSITGNVNTQIQDNAKDLPQAKVIIGPPNDTAAGILVLSDNNKAMILPKVDSPHLNIINPAPGMIVYDTKAHQLAVYNGTVWTFWRP